MTKRIFISILSGLLLFTACNYSTKQFFVDGVSAELAEYRAKFLSGIHYDLHFNIPEQLSEPVTGKVIVKFRQRRALHGVILDFRPGKECVHGVMVNGQESDFNYVNQHILVPSNNIFPGENVIEIEFTASDQALNRSEEFMYTLFVPDRASTAFPCFNQPDIKATYNLTLTIPESWKALSNGPVTGEKLMATSRMLEFTMNDPISTYLFAFAAGRLDTITKEQNGRRITIFHRETDSKRMAANADRIFRHHFESLAWLETYTGIPYPFEKFELAILPGFQYSGMEHPGAIWYRDDRLLLDENAPLMQYLRKASLIAHETAHMWFGNLVTMKWFDDVWLKEVFAGLMADMMIEPQFPDVNHRLQFFLSHYPWAYSIERSMGTHPVKQKLSNLNMAGTLYGPIIYNKAPIIFRQLEEIMAPEHFRLAVQEYLRTYAYSNATWDDLVEIFDRHTNVDINEWSRAWVYGSGLPQITYHFEKQTGTDGGTLIISQSNPMEPFPSQSFRVGILQDSTARFTDAWFSKSGSEVIIQGLNSKPQLIVLNGGGSGYGYIVPTQEDKDLMLSNPGFLKDENIRAAILLNLYEEFLNKGIPVEDYSALLMEALYLESNAHIINYLCNRVVTVIRLFTDPDLHSVIQRKAENLLWEKLQSETLESKQILFDSWLAVAGSDKSTDLMNQLYSGTLQIAAFHLSDQNMTRLACEIAVRLDNNNKIIETELKRIENPDRKRRFEFIASALSANTGDRDRFFEMLKKPENRNPEPWVLDALGYLHHPARNGSGEKYVAESLKMLEEIQQTGDIFFPKDWLDATLGNYKNPNIAGIVSSYLENHPELPENLRKKVLQSADLLFRASGFVASDQLSTAK